MLDRFGRKIEYVRISVTDRCNLRCRYCMPEGGVRKLRHEDILSYEEILRTVRALDRLGIRKVRLTGGEPLVRPGIVSLVRELKALEGIEQVTMTTNGVLLPEVAGELVAAGLDGVNISLDTLDEGTFFAIARQPLLHRALEGLRQAMAAGCRRIKLNCVPLRGVNEADLLPLAGLARDHAVQVRFIELMPVGGAFRPGCAGIPMVEVRRRIEKAYGSLLPVGRAALQGPAECFSPKGFRGELGFIDAMGHRFCASCNRVRLTAEGYLKLCLGMGDGLDVRALLRSGCTDGALEERLRRAILRKPGGHAFLEEADGGDRRLMYQVGG